MKIYIIMFVEEHYPPTIQGDYVYSSREKAQIALDNMWKESDDPEAYQIEEWDVK